MRRPLRPLGFRIIPLCGSRLASKMKTWELEPEVRALNPGITFLRLPAAVGELLWHQAASQGSMYASVVVLET